MFIHNLFHLHLLFFRLILATQGLGLMVPDIKDLLPDVDSTILSGVLEIIVEVSHQLFNAYLSFFSRLLKKFLPFFSLCAGSG